MNSKEKTEFFVDLLEEKKLSDIYATKSENTTQEIEFNFCTLKFFVYLHRQCTHS